MLNVIINADDFGDSPGINKAILKAFNSGWITSATIMANRPGFEEAIEYAHREKLSGQIGIHINLTLGNPLTDSIKKLSSFCDNEGMFIDRNRNTANGFKLLTQSEKVAVVSEVRAQIKRCRDNRLKLTHADSHQHKHEHWNIINLLMPVLKSEGLNRLRITRNIGLNRNIIKQAYRDFLNIKLRKTFKTTDYFGSFQDFSDYSSILKSKEGKFIEIMCHPKLDANQTVVDEGVELKIRLDLLQDDLQFNPISFNDLL